MEAWEPLFDKAMQALDSLPKHVPTPDWTFGGGTVLMRKYHHRLSRDVDIFLTDAQYLTLFSPRLNDVMADMTTQYREDSQHVKLSNSQYEVYRPPRSLGTNFRAVFRCFAAAFAAR